MHLALPIVGMLSFIGFVTCLQRSVWLTLAGTAVFAGIVYALHPFSLETRLLWIAASAFLVGALLVSWLPRPEKQTGKAVPHVTSRDQTVLDGTNILHWDGDGAQMATLRIVVDVLRQRGFVPIVFLDASTRHHLGDKALGAKGFARALGIKVSQVRICPAGAEADNFVLKYARAEGLAVVSNDRFRDRHSQIKGLKLIKGVIVNGRPIFDGF